VDTHLAEGCGPATALAAAAEDYCARFVAAGGYLAERVTDLRDVCDRAIARLLGQEEPGLPPVAGPCVLVAHDLAPAETAGLDPSVVLAIITEAGGALSHTAVLAAQLGIPAVVQVAAATGLTDGTPVAVDGDSGMVVVDPDPAYRAELVQRAEQRAKVLAASHGPGRTSDGAAVALMVNIGTVQDAVTAAAQDVEGVGLFRTELLFMRHMHLPSEDMQAETYSALAKAFAPHSVIVRTLDIGGDKPIAGIEFPDEENPFLGWRGIRMCLDRPDIFKRQLRALLRAAVHGNIKVMLPMVSEIAEVTRTRVLIDECAAELKAEGVPHAGFDLGVMIETPAAVLIAPALAKEVAFFSIGTNDLTQYIMAADRLNPTVAKLNDVTNPAVMLAIELTARAGAAAGIMVGMCGEAAGRPDLIPAFIKMGLTELSMSPASIQRAKKTIAAMSAER
jgi:phosphotransferase system enzyme I (PtsI)/phosphocarrier protein FPr